MPLTHTFKKKFSDSVLIAGFFKFPEWRPHFSGLYSENRNFSGLWNENQNFSSSNNGFQGFFSVFSVHPEH